MNKEKKMKPMTKEEYRNADVPMPKDEEDDYNKFLKNFFKGEKK